MKKLASICLISFSLSLSPTAEALVSAEGGFRVQMPGRPAFSRVVHKSIVGEVFENTFSAKTKAGEFTVSYTQLPDIALSMQSDKALLAQARDGFLRDAHARELRFDSIDLQGKEGRELAFEAPCEASLPACFGRARFFIHEKTLYVIAAVSSADAAPPIERFLNSFKLLDH